jgi:hypothetical protein
MSSISSAQDPSAAISSVCSVCKVGRLVRTLVTQEVPEGHLLLLLILLRSCTKSQLASLASLSVASAHSGTQGRRRTVGRCVPILAVCSQRAVEKRRVGCVSSESESGAQLFEFGSVVEFRPSLVRSKCGSTKSPPAQLKCRLA